MLNVKIDVNDAEVRRFILEKIEESCRANLLLWDISEMSKRLCMSESKIEAEFLSDPRMKLLERRKERGKRYWWYEDSVKVIQEIMDEW